MKPTFFSKNMMFIAGVLMLVLSLAFSTFSVVKVMSAPLASPVTVPSVVGFEGFLADASGNPIQPSGLYSVTFAVYGVDTGGTALWSETQSVDVQNGLYAVQLGKITPLTAGLFSGDRWIGVQMDGQTEITPRTAVASVPFALNAMGADTVDGLHAATSGQDAHVLASDTSGNVTVSGGLNVGTVTGAGAGQVFAPAGVSGLLPFTTYQGTYNLSGNTYVCVHTIDRDGMITRWAQMWVVATTNNASNYWTITVRRMDTFATLMSFTTAYGSPGAWTRYSSGTLSIPIATSMKGIDIYVTKTGSPGNLSLGHPAIYVP
jgi:hypothetical protein